MKVRDVQRGSIACKKVDFDIPPQPHGRHLAEIHALVANSALPESVRERAKAAFTALAEEEAGIHGIGVDDVHLHEVGAVDAILDVVGAIGGLEAARRDARLLRGDFTRRRFREGRTRRAPSPRPGDAAPAGRAHGASGA